MIRHHLQTLPSSFLMEPTLSPIGDAMGSEPIRLTIILKPRHAMNPAAPRLSRADFAHNHATDQVVIDRLVAYAQSHGLTVRLARAAEHRVCLSGTYAQARSAFEPDKLGRYRSAAGEHICRSGHLHVPPDLAEHVVAIMGFDERPVARPHFRLRPLRAAAETSYDPPAIAARYDFPTGTNGAKQTIALIELGGGYDAAQMSQYFAGLQIHRTGTLEAVPVDDVSVAPSGATDGPDGEVQLDIEVAGSVAPAANLAVYFGGNSSRAFLDTIAAAVHDSRRNPSVIAISWGGPETNWSAQDLDAMDQLFQTAGSLGITVCAASGDSGASDGSADGTLTVDFPASSPHVLGCGGTRLPSNGAESAWNDGPEGGASGGGYSSHFARPPWQSDTGPSGRGVPDVAGDADPATGYRVTLDGQARVVGGTSAVAPLWAALIARINQGLGSSVGFINPALYAAPAAFTDITSGNNNGYTCGPGWDPVTGLGTPIGSAIYSALKRH